MKPERLTPRLQQILDVRSKSIEEELRSFQRANVSDASRSGDETHTDLGLSDRELRSYSIESAARNLHSDKILSGLEGECHRELVKRYGPTLKLLSFYAPPEVLRYAPPDACRAMSQTPGQKGGFLIDTTITSFYDQLQNASIPVEVIRHTPANVIVVKQLTGPTFIWLGPPGSSVTASDPSFGQLSASPKTIVALTEISAQAQYQMGPVSEYGTRRNLALGLAAGKNQAIVAGTGGAQPL
ncbi:MAG: phage major capsid protein, partial [Nitrospirales bacterium]